MYFAINNSYMTEMDKVEIDLEETPIIVKAKGKKVFNNDNK